jgi:hypothetical protein
MALATDEEGYTLTRPAGSDRVTIARAVVISVRTASSEPRPRRYSWLGGGQFRNDGITRTCRRWRCTTSEDDGEHARSRQRRDDDSQQSEELGVPHPLRCHRRLGYGCSAEHIAVNERTDLL